jgi:hypothetical protein
MNPPPHPHCAVLWVGAVMAEWPEAVALVMVLKPLGLGLSILIVIFKSGKYSTKYFSFIYHVVGT